MSAGSDSGRAAELDPALLGGPVEAIEEVVRVQRVVMEEQQPLRLNPPRKGQGVGELGVTPAHVFGVLLVRVLAVVDQQVRIPGEVESGDPLRLQRLEWSPEAGL